jgi:hypothetical protein
LDSGSEKDASAESSATTNEGGAAKDGSGD